MQLSIISFTKAGKQLSTKIAAIQKPKLHINLYTKCRDFIDDNVDLPVLFVETSVGDWAREQMKKRNVLLFIGACGIAVRAIAPSLTDKLHDSPVLVADEKAKHIIPILSGHMGGANELANQIAEQIGAEPVITTATDINKKFAVDLFAKRNGLFIENKDRIVKISSKILAGREITMSIEKGHLAETEQNNFPPEVRLIEYPPLNFVDIVVTSEKSVFDASISLKPREYIIGFGCKKGKKEEEIDYFITKKLNELCIFKTEIFALSSISQKREEQGILEWCQKEGILFFTYPAKELQKVKGNFKKSSFVKEQVGVDNVCERAAIRACGVGGKLIAQKYAENGMTIAIAKREWNVSYESRKMEV